MSYADAIHSYLYHILDCYSYTYTQKNVTLMLKKLPNLSFLLFKKIFFVKIITTYLKKKD